MKYELRERAHEVLRAEMAESAFELILDRGYENLTADDLARHLGISRPTFYRYLGSKDEVIISAMLGPAPQFGDAFREAAVDPASSLWERLRVAFEPAVELSESTPIRQRDRLRLIQTLPALGAQLRRARAPQIENLADSILDAGFEVFTAHILAAAAVAVLDQSWSLWTQDDAASLGNILDRAFIELAAAGLPSSSSRTKGRARKR